MGKEERLEKWSQVPKDFVICAEKLLKVMESQRVSSKNVTKSALGCIGSKNEGGKPGNLEKIRGKTSPMFVLPSSVTLESMH